MAGTCDRQKKTCNNVWTGVSPCWRRWSVWEWVFRLVVLSHCAGVSVAQQKTDCGDNSKDVTVAVVVSVIVTLVVVGIVLAIVFFVLRRRHGGFFFHQKDTWKSIVSEEDGCRISKRDSCYDNPAFSARDNEDLKGMANMSPKRTSIPGQKVGNLSLRKDQQRTWSSMMSEPELDSGPCRRGSSGSLDNSKASGSEKVSVWLQSQDIIGLGFNISGNMRDGIYVSQVHNRGPAVESGKIQIGDRISSVTIAYDNMVYEDALTILSYASPYPVRVTVIKERASSAASRSGSIEQLNHPLYRSQSLDTMQLTPKDLHYVPKRTLSELNSETRKDSLLGAKEERRAKALSKSLPHFGSDVDITDVLGVHSDVMVHAAATLDDDVSVDEHQLYQDVVESEKNESLKCSQPLTSNAEINPGTTADRHSNLDTGAAREFVSLKEQSVDLKTENDDTILPQTVATVSSLPRTPWKPERKEKPSKVSIASEESLLEISSSDGGVEEVFDTVKTVHAEALLSHRQSHEVAEEEIQPTYVKREVIINTERFEFTLKKGHKPEPEPSESPKCLGRYVYIKSPPRPESPDMDPVNEDLIEASTASRDTQAEPPSHTSHGKATEKEKRQEQVLDDGALKCLMVTAAPPEISNGVGESNSETQGTRCNFVLHSDAEHNDAAFSQSVFSSSSSDTHREDTAHTYDVMTLDFSGMNGPPDKVVPYGSQYDDHLVYHSQNDADTTQNRDNSLDWSGKRLVRSGSFPEIPQGNSVSDWTDRHAFNDDDSCFDITGKRSAANTNTESDPMDPS